MKQVYKSEDGQIFDTIEECFRNDINILSSQSVEYMNKCFEFKRKSLPQAFREYMIVKSRTFEEYRLINPKMTRTEAMASFRLEYLSKLLNLKDLEKKYHEARKSLNEILRVKGNIEKELKRFEPVTQETPALEFIDDTLVD